MDTGLADRIRARGVDVVEVSGWQDRGHGEPDFAGFVWHHTAGGPTGIAPSLGICINGGANTAPGPLCNVLQSREAGEGNDRAFVIAAGTAYHAGYGGFNGLTGNSRVWGLEIEHVGTIPLPDHRRATAIKIAAGALDGVGATDASHACQHSEWSGYGDGSKIDVATEVDPDEWRRLLTDVLRGGPTPPPGGIDWPNVITAHQALEGANSMATVVFRDHEVTAHVDADGNLRHDSFDVVGQHVAADEVIVAGICDPNVQPSARVAPGFNGGPDALVLLASHRDGHLMRVWWSDDGWHDTANNVFTPPAH